MKLDRTAIALIGIAVAMLVVFVAIWSGPTSLRLGGHSWREGKVKKLAAAQLRDPSSAQFRNVRDVRLFVCGEINGKNGYGAYNGFVRFYGDEDNVTIDNEDRSQLAPGVISDADFFDSMWQTNCA